MLKSRLSASEVSHVSLEATAQDLSKAMSDAIVTAVRENCIVHLHHKGAVYIYDPVNLRSSFHHNKTLGHTSKRCKFPELADQNTTFRCVLAEGHIGPCRIS